MHLKIYNSLTKQLESFVPNDPDSITFYSCGPTVYDDAHIGNFRSFLAADLLRRWIESPLCTLQTSAGEEHTSPRTVTHVMNITDVGHMTEDDNADGGGQDKMELAAERLLESKKSGKLHETADLDPTDPRQIAAFYETRFKADAIALGLKVAIEDRDRKPSEESLMPRASDHVEHMKQVIVDLLNKGDAYAAGTPGSRAIYFNTQSFPNYGRLSGNTLDQLKGGAGGRVDDAQQSEKHHPADFLLWKEDDTHKMKWDAPNHSDCTGWSQGYPGWHIECTAMALNRLSNIYQLHVIKIAREKIFQAFKESNPEIKKEINNDAFVGLVQFCERYLLTHTKSNQRYSNTELMAFLIQNWVANGFRESFYVPISRPKFFLSNRIASGATIRKRLGHFVVQAQLTSCFCDDLRQKMTIDLHSGGEDNIFPHHECEIAQSCCFTGADSFANHWFHARFLKVEGQKMSKSKGTMYTLTDLTEKGIDPAAVRLELIKTHYRANADFSIQGLESSAKRINNWRRMAQHLQYAMDNDKGAFDHPNLNNAEAVVFESLSNDLNIAPCLGILDKGVKFSKGSHPVDPTTNMPVEHSEYIKDIYKDTILPEEPWDHQRIQEVNESNHPCEKQLATLHLIDNILGVIFRPIPKTQETTIALYQPGVTPSPEIESLLIARRDAKASKDWPAADAIRDQLTKMGLAVMDKPEGKVEVAPIN